jgi:hypothetical protein
MTTQENEVIETTVRQHRLIGAFKRGWLILEKAQFPPASLRRHVAHLRVVTLQEPEIGYDLREMETRALLKLDEMLQEDRGVKAFETALG